MAGAVIVAALAAGGVGFGLGRRRPEWRRTRPIEEDGLNAVLEASPLPILVSQPESGRVLMANAAARDLFAEPGKPLSRINPEEFYEDPSQRATFLARLVGRDRVDDFPAILNVRGGRRLDMRLSAQRVRFAGEDGLCVIMRDVTALAQAEARHQAVLAHLDAGIALVDRAGMVTYANPAAERLLAGQPGGLPGGPLPGASVLESVLRGGPAVHGALVSVRDALHGPDRDTWFRMAASPLGTDGAVCSFFDVTDLKAAEDALAGSAEAMRQMLDAAPLPILVLRRRGGDVLLANRSAQDAFALDITSPRRGDHWLDLYMDRAARRQVLETLRRCGSLRDHEVLVRPDGSTPRWMRLTAHSLSYFGVEAVMLTFADVSEARRLDRTLAQSEARRAQAEADLAQVVAAAERHLGAPLDSTDSAVEALARHLAGDARPAVAHLLARAEAAAGSAHARLRDLLAFARIGLEDSRPAMVDVADVLQEVRRALSVPIAEADAILQTESHLPVLRVDRDGLVRVLERLIHNALAYRHPERRPVVRLGARQECLEGRAVWHLRVSDNGVGIPHRHFDRIFELFERLHPEGGRTSGTGTGLAVCRSIVARMGGRIWVESTEDQGSVFHVVLPSSPADTLPLPTARQAEVEVA